MMNIQDFVHISAVLILLGVWLDVIKQSTVTIQSGVTILTQEDLNTYLKTGKIEKFEPAAENVVQIVLQEFANKNVYGKITGISFENIRVYETRQQQGLLQYFMNNKPYTVRVSAVPIIKLSPDLHVKIKPIFIEGHGVTHDKAIDDAYAALRQVKTRLGKLLM